MNSRTAKWATTVGAVAILTLSAGCASVGEVESLQAEVDALKGELAAAQGAASSAMSEAQAARAAAGDAAGDAAGAMSAANEAQAGSAANAEKIDRMFEKVMMK